jgi:hypothetical protein
VLQSGLVVDNDPDRILFANLNNYLTFFKNTLVRASGSPYERQIAQLYVDYVRTSDDPESVPLLIPEYRFGGKATAHRYRLDFTIINPSAMDKVGYELSPWSTHGYLKNIKGLTQPGSTRWRKTISRRKWKNTAPFSGSTTSMPLYTPTSNWPVSVRYLMI